MILETVVAEEEMNDPATPRAQPPTINHFFPNLSLREPKIGPHARVRRKFEFAIQLALDAPPTLMTWNLMIVLVVFENVAQQLANARAKMARYVFQPTR